MEKIQEISKGNFYHIVRITQNRADSWLKCHKVDAPGPLQAPLG
jgi:hypothetical protein